jgi:hypothetical protein
MYTVQICDSYIWIPLLQTYRSNDVACEQFAEENIWL